MYGWTKEQIQAAIDRHTQMIAEMVERHEPPEKIYKARSSLESLLRWREKDDE